MRRTIEITSYERPSRLDGGNIITANPDSLKGREALSKLDFLAMAELFMSPSAWIADIVLPDASYWETRHVRVGF